MPDTPLTDQRRLDAAAVEAHLRRLAKQASAPWLHAEVARRMAERLLIIRLQPARIIEWWSFLGASGNLLAEAYPDAHRILVEPNEPLALRSRAAQRTAWWSPKHWRRDPIEVKHESDEL